MSDLKSVYATVAELWCNPADVDLHALRAGAASAVQWLEGKDSSAARSLKDFVDAPVCDDYVELFELDPKCPLYLGAHTFEEPKTCAGAAVSDRNDYMIDLLGVYKHFKLAPNGKELPDYLPLILELLSITAGSPDPLRRKLVEEYVRPYLPAFRAQLVKTSTSYVHLLDAIERILALDMESAQPNRDPAPEATRG